MKKIIALMLAFATLLSFGVFAEETDVSDGAMGYELTTKIINLFGITEKNENQMAKEALINLANQDKETLHKVLNAIARTVDEHSYYYDEEE